MTEGKLEADVRYTAWLTKRVEISLSDPRPLLSQAEAIAGALAIIESAEARFGKRR